MEMVEVSLSMNTKTGQFNLKAPPGVSPYAIMGMLEMGKALVVKSIIDSHNQMAQGGGIVPASADALEAINKASPILKG